MGPGFESQRAHHKKDLILSAKTSQNATAIQSDPRDSVTKHLFEQRSQVLIRRYELAAAVSDARPVALPGIFADGRASLGNGWQAGGRSGCGFVIDRLLISEKEKRFVAAVQTRNLQRSAHHAAKLVALERIDDLVAGGGAIREIIGGIQIGIAHILEQVAVILIRAALGDDIHHPACILAILRVVVVGLDAELLHSVGHRKGQIDVGVFVYVVADSSTIPARSLRRHWRFRFELRPLAAELQEQIYQLTAALPGGSATSKAEAP